MLHLFLCKSKSVIILFYKNLTEITYKHLYSLNLVGPIYCWLLSYFVNLSTGWISTVHGGSNMQSAGAYRVSSTCILGAYLTSAKILYNVSCSSSRKVKHDKEHLLDIVQHHWVVGSPRRGAKGFWLMLPLGLMIALHHDSVCCLTGFVLRKAHLPEMCEFAKGPRTILVDQGCDWAPGPGQVLHLVMWPRKMSLRKGCGGTVQWAEPWNLSQHWNITKIL